MVITIDGPAAAGKSTVARMLARRLGFDYLDTGAMYRAATWKLLQSDPDVDDPQTVARLVRDADIGFSGRGPDKRVLCDGRDVTDEIRTPRVTRNIYRVADEPAAREPLIEAQRRIAGRRDLVTEGRDQGTDVFPDAAVKFYLDASAEERASRRLEDLHSAGHDVGLEDVLEQVRRRDREDNSRPVGSLRRTDDMVVIDSTGLTAEQVVERMLEEVSRRCPAAVRDAEHRAEANKSADERT